MQVAGCRLQVAGCRLQVAGCRLQVAGCRLQVQVAGCRLQVQVAGSNNNDCYSCNPVDLEKNLMFAGLPNHSPLLNACRVYDL